MTLALHTLISKQAELFLTPQYIDLNATSKKPPLTSPEGDWSTFLHEFIEACSFIHHCIYYISCLLLVHPFPTLEVTCRVGKG